MESFLTLETLGVVAAIVYLVLAIRQNIWCWGAALISTTVYLYVFFEARLYMESGLQVFYIAMAFYGWYQWRRGDQGGHIKVSTWSASRHVMAIALVLGVSVISSWVLARYTNAALPLLDSVTTWGSVVATYMVARKVFENWHYWFVIDSLSIYLYLSRDLHQTAMLFAVYLVLIVVGWRSWRKDLPASVATE